MKERSFIQNFKNLKKSHQKCCDFISLWFHRSSVAMIGALEHGFYRVRLLIQDVLLWPGDQTSINSFQFTAAIHGRGLTEKSSWKFSFSRGKNITIHDHDSCSDIDMNKPLTGWPQQQQSEHKKIFWLNFTSYFYINYWHAEAHKWI